MSNNRAKHVSCTKNKASSATWSGGSSQSSRLKYVLVFLLFKKIHFGVLMGENDFFFLFSVVTKGIYSFIYLLKCDFFYLFLNQKPLRMCFNHLNLIFSVLAETALKEWLVFVEKCVKNSISSICLSWSIFP